MLHGPCDLRKNTDQRVVRVVLQPLIGLERESRDDRGKKTGEDEECIYFFAMCPAELGIVFLHGAGAYLPSRLLRVDARLVAVFGEVSRVFGR